MVNSNPPWHALRYRSTILHLVVGIDIKQLDPYPHRTYYEARKRAFPLVSTPRRPMYAVII